VTKERKPRKAACGFGLYSRNDNFRHSWEKELFLHTVGRGADSVPTLEYPDNLEVSMGQASCHRQHESGSLSSSKHVSKSLPWPVLFSNPLKILKSKSSPW
jgi:hypothetical protein